MRYAGTINFFKLLLSTAILVVLIGPMLLIIPTFLVYRTMVLIVLKIKFGSKFGSLMGGLDAFFSSDANSGNIINVIMIVRTPNSYQEFFGKFKDTIHEKIFKNERQFPKFLSTRHKMGGYHYFIPNRVEINKCVRSFNVNCANETMSREELFKEISNYSKQPLPYDNKGFWEFLFCEKPVAWNNRIDKTQKSYAVLLRFHHSLADGVTLVNFLLNIFSDSYGEKTVAQTATTQNKFCKIWSSIFILLITPMVLISQILFQHVEISSLNDTLPSDQQILVANIEESSECLKIIKGFKQKMKDTSFTAIITTAISKSLSNYFQKKGKDSNLNSLNVYFTVLMKEASNFQAEQKSIKLKNRFSYFNFNIPIVYTTTVPISYWKTFVETLDNIKIKFNHINTSPDYRVTYGLLQLVAYIFPESIVGRVVTFPYKPLLISNVPGPSAITLYGDCLIEDIVFWVPRAKQFGMTLGIFSYDKRLQIALTVDKAIISDERDAQDIVDGIYQALIKLDSKI